MTVWRIHCDDERQLPSEMLRSRSGQIAMFSENALETNSYNRVSSVLSCSPDDTRIAYIGPSPRILRISDGPTLQTLVKIDLDQLARQVRMADWINEY